MVLDVNIVNGASCIDIALFVVQIIALGVSVATIAILIVDRRRQRKSENMNLTITPKDKTADCRKESFFLYLSFTNESSLPISILDMHLSVDGGKHPTDSDNGNGGMILIGSIPVTTCKSKHPGDVSQDRGAVTLSLPLTIEPYASTGGYFAFHAGKMDAQIICHKEILLRIRTSRKVYAIEVDLNSSNYMDFSYHDDGSTSGDAVITGLDRHGKQKRYKKNKIHN